MENEPLIKRSANKLIISIFIYLIGGLTWLMAIKIDLVFFYFPFPIAITGILFNIIGMIEGLKIKTQKNKAKKIALVLSHLILAALFSAFLIYIVVTLANFRMG